MLEPYRPIFIGATLVALFSHGGASTARRKPANRVRSARFPKCELLTSSFFWIVVALVTVSLGFPYVMPFFY